MFEFVELTDGTYATACELTDGTRFAFVGYNLQVAALSDSELGSDGPYTDSVDQITFHALGCTAAEAYANAAAVNLLLDQAYRWWVRADATTMVRIQLRAQNATQTLYGIVKGRAPGSPPPTALPATWSEFHGKFIIESITVQFARKGRLLNPTTESISVASQPVPTVMLASYGNPHLTLSPLRVDFTGAPGNAGSTILIAVTPLLGGLTMQTIIEAESGSFGPDVTSVADAANSARGGSVARYTAPAIPIPTENTLTIPTIAAAARRFVVIMAARKNQTTTVFDISCSFRRVSGATAAIMTTTDTQRISGTNVNPRLIIFDPVATRDQPNSLVLNINPVTAVAGNTFDIDYVAIIAVDDVASTVLSIAWPSLGANETISINPLTDEPTARVQVVNGGVNFPVTYMGNPAGVSIRGQVVSCSLFATGGASDPTRWRMYDAVAAAVAQLGLTVTRQRAHLIPE